MLIAVPPVPGQDWTAETLRRVLMETLDLAKLRAVDTASLGAAAQHLPGLYLAFNTEDHAVSTDFRRRSRTDEEFIMPPPQLFVTITSPTGRSALGRTARSRSSGNISWLFTPSNWSLTSKSAIGAIRPGRADCRGNVQRQHAQLAVHRHRQPDHAVGIDGRS